MGIVDMAATGLGGYVEDLLKGYERCTHLVWHQNNEQITHSNL